MLMSYKRGQGSIVLRVKILDSTASTGAGKTGLTSASSGLIISTIADNEATATAYTVAASNVETITTLGTFSAPTSGKCRFKEVDATNHKGVYEIQIADARFAVSSAKSLLVSISGATAAAETDAVIPLTDADPYDVVRGGYTALPNTACTTNGSLLTSGTGTAQLSTSSGQVLLQSGTGTGQVKLSSGYVAPNWGDVGNPTTTLALTGTTIATTQKVDVETIKTNAVVNSGTVTFPSNATLASTTNITAAAGVTLGNTAHGGSSATITLQSVNITNSTGDAVTISSTGNNGHGIYMTANGGGDGFHIIGGSTGNGLHVQGGSTSGDGLHAVAPTLGDGIQATGAGGGLDINGTLTAVTTATNLTNLPTMPTDWVTAAGLKSDAIAEIQSGLATASSISALNDIAATDIVSNGPITTSSGAVSSVIDVNKLNGSTVVHTSGKLWVLNENGDPVSTGVSTFDVGTDTVLANVKEINDSVPAAQNLAAVYAAFENGTAQSGGPSLIQLRVGASSQNDFYKNQAIFLLEGAGAGQTNRGLGYDGTTKELTVSTPWVIQPDNTTKYFILGRIG